MPLNKTRLFAGMAGLLSLQAGVAGIVVSRSQSAAQTPAPAAVAPAEVSAADSEERRAYAETQKIVLSMIGSESIVAFPEYAPSIVTRDSDGVYTVSASYFMGFSPVPHERYVAKIKRKGDGWQCMEIDWR